MIEPGGRFAAGYENHYTAAALLSDSSSPFLPMSARQEDPVLTSARREAWLVFAIWLAACVWSLGVCYRFGYGRDAATLTYVLGFPDWIFWGVIVPWTACTVVCFVMAYFVITDEDLGEEQKEQAIGEEADHAR